MEVRGGEGEGGEVGVIEDVVAGGEEGGRGTGSEMRGEGGVGVGAGVVARSLSVLQGFDW